MPRKQGRELLDRHAEKKDRILLTYNPLKVKKQRKKKTHRVVFLSSLRSYLRERYLLMYLGGKGGRVFFFLFLEQKGGGEGEGG